jgi:hypothetical protein
MNIALLSLLKYMAVEMIQCRNLYHSITYYIYNSVFEHLISLYHWFYNRIIQAYIRIGISDNVNLTTYI